MGELPDFLIVGTQKGGTTWLEHQLGRHGQVFTPGRQLHFFDRHFDKGTEWYRAQFAGATDGQTVGEKTTEYFDTLNGDRTAERIAQTLSDARLIVILRDPVDRALSALRHMVNSGLEPMPSDPSAALFGDADKPEDQRWRYVERGFYARQLETLYAHVDRERVLVLILEDDIRGAPDACWARVCDFLGIDHLPAQGLDEAVNMLRLSALSIRLSKLLYAVPYARGAIRRIDGALGLRPWKPVFAADTRARLADIYRPHNQALFALLGREIPAWEA